MVCSTLYRLEKIFVLTKNHIGNIIIGNFLTGQDVATGCIPHVNFYICCSATFPVVKNCGTDQNGTSGIIQSPNYPNAYGNGAACVWNIMAPAGTAISLNITYFQTEANDRLFILLPQNCSNPTHYNYLSGNKSALSYRINQNTVALYFYSDAKITQSGFSITWNSSSVGSSPSCLSSLGYGNLTKTCGSDKNGTSGIIETANYPYSYDNNASCSWNIAAPAGSFITLNITSLLLEPCCDFLYILWPQNCSSVINKRLTGKLSSNIITVPQNTVSLALLTDSRVAYSGFSIRWTAIPYCVFSINTYYYNNAFFYPQVCVSM
jgi:CUB domain